MFLAVAAAVFTLASPLPVYNNAATYASNYVQLPQAHVAVLDRACPAYAANSGVSCVYADNPNVIYTDQKDQWIFLHELGHVYDFTKTMKPWQRLAFRVIMRDFRPWMSTKTQTGMSEKFADAYANCALGLEPSDPLYPITGYNYKPTTIQSHLICNMLRPHKHQDMPVR